MTCSCVGHPGCRASGGRARPHSLAGVACTPHPSAPGPLVPGQRPWTIHTTGRGLVYATALPTILQFLPHTQPPCRAAGLGGRARTRPAGGRPHPPGPPGRTLHIARRAPTPGTRHPCGVPTAAHCCLPLAASTRWQPATCPPLPPTRSAAHAHHRHRVSGCSRLPRRDGPGTGREAGVLASLWETPPSYLLETPSRIYWRHAFVPTGDAPSYLLETRLRTYRRRPLVPTRDTARTYRRRASYLPETRLVPTGDAS
jgi:hypothetical protein